MSVQADAIWQSIAEMPRPTLATLFADDAARVSRLSHRIPLAGTDILFDFAKTHLDAALIAKFEELSAAMHLAGMRDQLLAGAKINTSEDRAAEHPAERGMGAEDSVENAQRLHERMAALVEAIDQGVFGEIKHVLHIGIGGSALGPKLIIDALCRDSDRYDVAVVANVDGEALSEAVDKFDPTKTLVAIASKTFTTTETLMNAESAIDWLRGGGVEDPYGQLVALTAAPEKAMEFGIDETRILPFSETVGGRYSVWSSIGFPVAMALGNHGFAEFRAGALAMDRHFATAPLAANMPVLAAFVDLYYAQVRTCQTRAVFAYDERLRLLPDYLQQLEMESNGKGVRRDGSPLGRASAPITWGGVGTDAQHAVFQLLHQGTHLVPVEFIASRLSAHEFDEAHHRALLTNCFAQGAALMQGKASDDPQRSYPGDRPSMTILLDNVDPQSLGALIAFYEHRTFANAMLLGINPFDQFGVELGKEIAKSMGNRQSGDFDPSTVALIEAAGL
ncbi:glucose-6-phosphate isomerase [Sphingomonas ursincola]|uniref:Glucose-6-phosphate isomerase n=1 Tax=Sphingomonas ursincola TaxID=56361 RepID=A0A7V8RA90_9SPHN|nr:glucose-6-phosphate isomerase [Sphingomonas ursincola]MBA1372762.1 glucose-6-phosphate isomerase [Sphingomonas ursincola]